MVQGAITLRGALDLARLGAAWQQIVARYELLRTTFPLPPGKSYPVQVIHELRPPAIVTLDLRGRPGQEQAAALLEQRACARARPWPLAEGPLAWLDVAALADTVHVVLITLSAFCADPAALALLAGELLQAYAALQGGPALEEDPLQYADLTEWLNEGAEGPNPLPPPDPGRATLAALLEQTLPCALPQPGAFQPRTLPVPFDEARRMEIEARLRETPYSLEMYLEACWHTLLWHQTRGSETLAGTWFDGRHYAELSGAIGPLGRYLPVRCRWDASQPFRAVLEQVRQAHELLVPSQDQLTWEKLVGGQDQPDAPVAFPVLFELHTLPGTMTQAGLVSQIELVHALLEPFAVRLIGFRTPDGLLLELAYDAGRMCADDMQRLAPHLAAVIADGASRIEEPAQDLHPLSPDEQRVLLAAPAPRPAGLVHELFAAQAAARPAADAVVCGDERLSYGELDRRAAALAGHLRALGVRPEARVALYLERSIDLVVGLLAVLKAGAAYVPLEPGLPSGQLAQIMSVLQAPLILTQQSLAATLPALDARVVCLDQELAGPVAAPVACVQPHNAAYVIFTSGSTGVPKGVVVEHGQLANYVQAICAQIAPELGDRFAIVSTFAADLGHTMTFPALCCGGTLHIAPPQSLLDPEALAGFMEGNAIDYLKIVPSHLAALLNGARPAALLPRKWLITGGETLHRHLAAQIRVLAPDCRLLNHYGPTETTVGILTNPVTALEDDPRVASMPLGSPLAGAQVYLLDADLRPVPTWVPGEIFLGGATVARGYLGQPAATAERFVPNPFPDFRFGSLDYELAATDNPIQDQQSNIQNGERLYRTGDRARRLPDGRVEFLGRVDHQVKVRGYRIELDGITAVLRQHPAVQDAALMLSEDAAGHRRLVAYVAPRRRYAPTIAGQPRYRLPNQMAIAQLNAYETDFFYQQIFDNRTELRHGVRLPQQPVVLDVGANIGLFSLAVAQLRPGARIYSFEPIPPIYEALRTNLSLYAPQAAAVRCGLSDSARDITFTYYPHSSCQSGYYADVEQDMATLRAIMLNQPEQAEALGGHVEALLAERSQQQQFTCQLKTISQIIAECGLTQIDLLKIDVEKSEYDILRGIGPQDWGKIAQIVIEAHDVDGQVERVSALLREQGYTLVVEQSDSISGTNLYNVYATRLAPEAAASASIEPLPALDEPFLTGEQLRAFLSTRLPEYMQPAAYILLEALPLTPNGKVDWLALPSPEQQAEAARPPYAPPQTPVEQALCQIWQQVLGVAQVGIHDNFLALGGDSILSILVVAQAGQRGLRLTTHDIFQYQTVAALAVVVRSGGAAQAPQGPVSGAVPLTPIQHWFLSLPLPNPSHWNQALLVEVPPAFDPAAFERALTAILEHHDALRLRLVRDASGWQQRFEPPHPVAPVERIDLSGQAEWAQAITAVATELQAGLDLSSGPIVRGAHFDRGEGQPGRLLLVVHHMAVDGVSWRILLEDLQAAYYQSLRGERPALPAKTSAYSQWAERLLDYARSPELEAERAWWEQMRDCEAPALPCDTPGGANTEALQQRVIVTLGAEATEALLHQAPAAYGTQIGDLLLTALVQTLAPWLGEALLLVELEGHGRESIFPELDLSRTVGWYTVRYPALLDLRGIWEPGDAIKAVKEQLRAIPNHGLGYGVLRYLSPSFAALPQPGLAFNYLGQLGQEQDQAALFRLTDESTGPDRAAGGTRPQAIEINGWIFAGQLHLEWSYSAGLHQRATIAQLAQQYLEALQLLIAHCQNPLAGGYTPSDFPAVQISQDELDRLVSRLT